MSEAMVTLCQNRTSGMFNPKPFSGVTGNIFLKYAMVMIGSGLFLYVIFANTVNGNFRSMNIYNVVSKYIKKLIFC